MDKYLAKARNLASRFGAEDKIEKEVLNMYKDLINILESEKWYPKNPTELDFEVSNKLNRIIDDLIVRLKKHETTYH